MRTCAGCGTPEDRKVDKAGRKVVNLDPTTGLCVACLVKSHTTFQTRRTPGALEPFDARAAAARNDE